MNKIFRVIWNASLGRMVVAGEFAKRFKRGSGVLARCTAAVTAGAMVCASPAALADGRGGNNAAALGGNGASGGAGGGGGTNGVGGTGSAVVAAGQSGSNGNGGAGSVGGTASGGSAGTAGAGGSVGSAANPVGGNGGDGGDAVCGACTAGLGASGGGGGGDGLNGSTLDGVIGPIIGGNGGNGGSAVSASVSGADGGGGGGAGAGAFITGTGSTSTSANITGGRGGDGGSSLGPGGAGFGGGGGSGVVSNGVSITNTFTVQGGDGGDGGDGAQATHGRSGGTGGAGIIGASLSLNNSGIILGGNGGTTGLNPNAGTPGAIAAGGVGIQGSGLQIINTGTISGGLNGNGTVRANAISFTGGVNSLTLLPGWRIIGNVAGTGTNTLIIGGDTTDLSSDPSGRSISTVFDVSQIGTSYQGFSSFQKTGASTWLLLGSTTAVTPWTIASGSLQMGNDALGAASGALTVQDGGSLITTGTFGMTRATTLGGGNAFFDVAPDTTLSMGGVISGAGALNKLNGGTLVLTATNTYSGITNISAGTLQVGAGGTVGTIVGDVINNGTLTFSRSNAYSFAGLISGSGALNKLAAGVTTLTADNSYTGGTTISAGTLQLGAGGTTGSIVGDVTNNGTLTFNRSNAYTFSGLISGTGAVTKLAVGTTTLTADNTYAGITTITGGTLQLGDGGTTGSITGNVVNNAALAFNRADDIAFGGVISGTGNVSQLSNGVLTLTGTNTYSGGTTIVGGTVSVGANANLGAAAGTVTLDGGTLQATAGFTMARAMTLSANNGTIQTDTGATLTNSGVISGASGALTKTGEGSLVLTGASTYGGITNIAAGTLQIGAGATVGSIVGDVINNGTLTFNRSNAYTFAGLISGSGAVNKLAAGVTTLTADNTYTGGTTITAGTLQLGAGGTVGSIVGDVTNNATLTFNRSNALTFDGLISGTGAVTKLAAGTTTLTADNTYTGITTITGGILQLGDGGSAGSVAGNIVNNAILAVNRSNDVTLGGVISGTGVVRQIGDGTTTLTGTNTYSGGTTIADGTLSVGANANLGATTGAVTLDGGTLRTSGSFVTARAMTITANNGTVQTDAGTTLTANGVIAGASGGLTKTGEGTLVLTANNTYGGGTTISAGTVSVAANLDLGAATGGVTLDGGTLATTGSFTLGRAVTITGNNGSIDTAAGTTLLASGVITGADGALTKAGAGTLTLTGENTYANGTTIAAGTLQLGTGATGGSIQGDVLNNGTLTFNRVADFTLAGAISGTGAVNKLASGVVTLTGDNSYSGGTTISAGTLRIGNGGTTGTIAGNITNNATLVFDRSNDLTYAGAITGTGTLTQAGTGITTFTGGPSSVGRVNVTAGTLDLDQTGTFSVADDYTTASGATTRLGAGLTLAVGDVFTQATGSTLDVELGDVQPAISANSANIGGALRITGFNASVPDSASALPGASYNIIHTAAAGGITNDFSSVTLDGSDGTADYLTVSGGKSANAQDYNVGFGLTWLAGATLGNGVFTLDDAADTFNVDVVLANQAASATGWDGTTLTKEGLGTLILSSANTYTGPTLINAGTLRTGIENAFASSGSAYLASGATLDLDGFNQVVNNLTGDGNVALGAAALTLNHAADATFGGVIGGTGSVIKTGAAALTLTGDSDYTGGTTISAGTLQVGAGGTTGSITGNVLNDGSLVFNRSDDIGFAGDISGAGALTKLGGGSLTLTGSNSYGGGTTISAGTLQLGDGGTSGSIVGDVVNNDALDFNRSDDVSFGGTISGSGAVTQIGTGTTTLTADNTYAGGTTITAGTLQLGDGNTTGAITGDVANDGTLAFNRADDVVFAGAITGSGSLSQRGDGTTTLTADNTYTGGTTITAGTLQLGDGGTTGAIVGDIRNDGALVFNRSDALTQSGAITGVGSLTQAGSGVLTLTNAGSSVGNASVTAGTLALAQAGAFTVTGDYVTASGATTELAANATLSVGNAFTQAAGSTLDVAIGSAQPIISAASADIGGTLNITGFSASVPTSASALTSTLFNLISTTSGISNDFSSVTFGSAASPVDYLTLAGSKSADQLSYNVGFGLTWLAGATRADGSFTLTNPGDIFTVDVVLADQAASATGWDGTTLTKNGQGTLVLSAANTYTGATLINAGTLRTGIAEAFASSSAVNVAGGATLDLNNFNQTANNLAGAGNVTLGSAVLTVNDTIDTQVSGVISGSGGLVKTGAATLTLTGENTYGGGTTISEGTLQVGDGGTTGSLVGDVANDGTLAFNRSNTLTYDGVLSGTGSLNQLGTGTTVLTGDSGTFSGNSVVSNGTLQVDGTLGAATSTLSVSNGGTLAGHGTIGGDVSIADGILAPGNSPGTLTINGDLALAAASTLNYEFGQAGVVGGPLNDLTVVGGDLTLDGTLNVTTSSGGSFGAGLYRIIDYSGSLTDNGLEVGTAPSSSYFVQTSVANQVNLINTNGLTLGYWDGAAGPRNNNVINGGSGLWQSASGNDNWTTLDGSVNAPFTDAAFAVFTAAPGTVDVDNSLGAVTASGMQFASSGYVLQGDAITLVETDPATPGVTILRVGDGTGVGAGYVATINAVLGGAVRVEKSDLGTLVLGGANTYTGGTTISAGTVSVGADANLGAAAGDVTLDGGTLATTASFATARTIALSGNNGTLQTGAGTTLTADGVIDGAGALTKSGDGTLVMTADNSYAGGTTISAGTLQLGSGGSTGGLTGDVVDNGILAFNRSDDVIFSGAISGTGAVDQQGSGTTVLTADNSYAGGTSISAGTLQLGDGGTVGSIIGDVVDNGTLVFNRSDDIVFSGLISGTGHVDQAGGGTTVLTADNTYGGGTTISAGTLQLGDGGNTGSIIGDVVDNGTLAFNRSDDITFAGTISGSGDVSHLGGGTTTLTADNTYTGGTTITAGSLQLGDGGTTGSIIGDVVDNGALVFNRSDDVTFAGAISGAGTVSQIGSGVVTLTADNAYTGGTTISAGTLQLGDGGSTGSIVGDISNDGALVFNRSNALDYAGTITGSGSLTQAGTGTTTLTGSNSSVGNAQVSAGTLNLAQSGAFTVAGNYATATGATTQIAADAGLSVGNQFIQAAGSTLNVGLGAAQPIITATSADIGGTLNITGFSASAPTSASALTSTRRIILHTTDGISNDFSAVTFGGASSPVDYLTVTAGKSIDALDYGIGFGLTWLAGAIEGNGVFTLAGAADLFDVDVVLADQTASATGWDGTTLTKNGAGTLVLSAVNTYSGPTLINAGTLRAGIAEAFANSSAVSLAGGAMLDLNNFNQTANNLAGAGNVTLGSAALTVNDTIDTQVSGVISGTGSLVKTGAATLMLTGENTYSGGTTISEGTLQIGDGGTTGTLVGDVANAGTLAFNRSNDLAFAGTISGTGSVNQIGAGTTTLTADNTYTGGTTIANGTLQLGDGGATGSVVGDIRNDGALVFNRSNDLTYAGAITGSGSLTQAGTGVTTLTNAGSSVSEANVIAGELNLAQAGTFTVTGDYTTAAGAATRLGEDTTLSVGGVFTQAAGSALDIAFEGPQPVIVAASANIGGTLHITGFQADLPDSASALTGTQFNIITTTGGIANDFSSVVVDNTVSPADYLTLAGGKSADQLNYNVGFGLTWLAGATLGNGVFTLDDAADTFDVDVVLANQAASATGWDGATLTKNGQGTLVLSAANTYTGQTLINAGTLRAGIADAFISSSAVTVGGGATLDLADFNQTANNLAGAGNVTLGSAALTVNDTVDTRFSGVISGSGSLIKTGAAALTLAGANTYTGGTTISAGTLQVGEGGTAGSITGNVLNDGSLVFNRSDDIGFSGDISGAGALTKLGGGSLTLTGSNSYGGGTTISAGTLQLGDGGTSGSIVGDVVNNGALDFNRSDDVSFGGTISGSGAVTQVGTGTTTLTADNTYAGGTTITAGTLQLGDGNTTGAITGDVANDGTLAFNRADDVVFAGAITGSGSVDQIGDGTTTLTADNTYTGGTTITAGTLQLGDGGTTGAIVGDIRNDGALVFNRSDALTQSGAITGVGSLTQAGSGVLTLTNAGSSVGNASVAAGTLALAQAGAFTVTGDYVTAGGATTQLAANATLSVGNAFTQAAGSTLDVAIGSAQPIISAASADIGGTLNITGFSASVPTSASALTSTLFNLISTTNGISNDFSSVTFGSAASPVDYLTLAGSKSADQLSYNVGFGLTWLAGATRADGSFTLTNPGDIFTVDVVLADQAASATGWDGTTLTKNGQGTLVLSAANTYTGATLINAGTLRTGIAEAFASSSAVNVAGGATLDLNNFNQTANNLAGAGNVTLGSAVLTVNDTIDTQVSGVISGSGGLVKTGAATLTLTGENTYGGGTTISEGTLQVGDGGTTGSLVGDVANDGTLAFNRSNTLTYDGVLSGTGSLNQLGTGTTVLTGDSGTFSGNSVVSNGTLQVDGTLGAATSTLSVSNGGTLAGHGTIGGDVSIADGILAPGNSPGTLTINGDLALAAASTLNYEFGQAGVVGGPLNDLTVVGGDLTLDGTLNVTTSSGGSFGAGLYRIIDYSGSLTDNGLEVGTAPSSSYFVQTSVANQVNLINTNGLTLGYWDGAAGPRNNNVINGGSGLWQSASGNDNWTTLDGSVNAPFTDAAFAVFTAAPGTVDVDNSLGAVTASGMQFASSGYVLQGDAITLVETDPATPGVTILRVGDGTGVGAGYVATINAVLGGAVRVEKSDLGTLVLGGANTYTGGTTISAGTVSVGADANLGAAAGDVTLDGGTLATTASFATARAITLSGNNGTLQTGAGTTLTADGVIDGAGALTKSGDGTLVMTADNSYAGGTTISAGTLQLGDGGSTGSIVGDISNDGALVFNRSNALDYAGTITGSGSLTQAGTGTTTLTGSNSSVGNAQVSAGTLNLAQSGAFTVAGNYATATGATTQIAADAGLSVGNQFIQAAGSTLNVGLGAAQPIITATSADIGGTLNITGFSASAPTSASALTSTRRIILHTTDGISNDFSAVTFGGASSPVDYLTVTAGKSIDALDYGIGFGLTWLAGAIEGNGVFTLAGAADLFDVDVVLADQTASATGWDGTTLTKNGAGTLVLSAVNTYSGPTLINAGTLRAGIAEAFANSSAVNVAGGATLDLDGFDQVANNLAGSGSVTLGTATLTANNIADTTFAGGVSGSGGVTKTGAAVLTLTGDSTYTGGTTITAGTLQLGNGATTGSIVGDVANDGTLAFNRSNDLAFAGTISGTGSVNQIGAGTTTLTADNTYTGGTTIANGTLQLGDGGATGSVVGDIRNDGALVFNRSNDLTYAGAITGSGSLTQAGTGVTTLTNAGSSVSEANVIAGELNLAQAGTFTVTGDYTTAAGAATRLGEDTTLSVGGVFTQAAGSALDIAFEGPQPVIVAASANIGGTLDITGFQADLPDSASALTGTLFNIITTTGGISNDFDSVVVDNTASPADYLTLAGGKSADQLNYNVGFGLTWLAGTTLGNGVFTLDDAADTFDVDVVLANQAASATGWDGATLTKNGQGTLVLSAANTYTGQTLINAGTLRAGIADAFISSSAVTVGGGATLDLANFNQTANNLSGAGSVLLGSAALTANTTIDTTFGGVISGAGSMVKTGASGLTLTGNSVYTGGTIISAGTLQLGNGGTAGLIVGDVVDNGVLAFNRSNDITFAGIISGTGAVTQLGTGTTVLTGNNLHAGGTTISAGTLQLGNGGTSGSITGDVTDNGVLAFNRSDATTFAGAVSGSGAVTHLGTGTTTLTAANTYLGGTSILAGTLQLGSGGTTGSITGNVVDNGTLAFNRSDAVTFAGQISGTGAVTHLGSGTTTLIADHSYSGGTTIAAGTLQVGNGGSTGSIMGNVVDNATLAFNRADTFAFGGALSGSGIFNHIGTGTTRMTGNSSAFAGATNVTSGTVQVDGILGSAVSLLTVASGGRLGGNGTVGGDVSIFDGILAPGTSPGTLTIGGDLTLSSASILDYEFGQAGVVGGAFNDLTVVGGDLTLDGTINVGTSSGGVFGPGLYRIISYGGALTDNGLDINTVPAGSDTFVHTGLVGQVNLVNTAGLTLNYWDGAIGAFNGQIDGGNGIWQSTSGNLNWTEANGDVNAGYADGDFAIFAGTPGTVTVDTGLGAITSSGMQFATNGYRVQGDEIVLAPGSNILRVGDGTAAGQGYVATIASVLGGSGGVDKTDLGTLVLTGANGYTGGTTITAGTLQLGDGTTTGSIIGNVTASGTLAFNNPGTTTFTGTVSGTGGVKQVGGTTVFTANHAYTGGTTISGGTLALGDGGTTGSIVGNVVDNGILAFNRSDAVSFAGAISGSGHVTHLGSGTTTLTAANTYTGGTTLSAGTLRIGGGGTTGSLVGNVTNNAALEFNRSNLLTYAGTITGSGSLTQIGSGTTTLTGTGSSVGTANVNAGVLALGQSGAFNVTDDYSTASGAATQIAAGSTLVVGDLFTQSAGSSLNVALGGAQPMISARSAAIGGTLNVTGFSASLPTTASALTATQFNLIHTIDGITDDFASVTFGGASSAVDYLVLAGRKSADQLDYNVGLGLAWLAGPSVGNGIFTLQNAAATFDVDVVLADQAASATGWDGTTLTKRGAGTLILSAVNTYTGPTQINAGVLRTSIVDAFATSSAVSVGSGATLDLNNFNQTANNLSGAGSVVLGTAALTANNTADTRFAGAISGTGSLVKTGPTTLTLTGTSSYTGGTTISAGTLQLGDGGTSGGIAGNVIANGTLAFNRADAVSFAGSIGGSGSISHVGGGTTRLTGNSNAFAGSTNVTRGTLQVDGTLGASNSTLVAATGGTLAGNGTVGGNVALQDGVLAPGNSVGTLNIGGNLSLTADSLLNFEFGEAGVVGGQFNDLAVVGGNLTLDGTLNVVTPSGAAFDPGVYRIIDYSGTLANNGLDLGVLPTSTPFFVQTDFAGQVNLVNTRGLTFEYWDGAGPKFDGVINGGDGVWQGPNGNDNWTETNATVNGPFANGAFAVFGAQAGTVTVDNSVGAVTIAGMQFATDGYRVEGDPITLLAGDNVIRVGDGTQATTGFTATIDAPLVGSGGIDKSDVGTLILTGTNTYTGGTIIGEGVLQLGAGGTGGSIVGPVVNDGVLAFDRSDAATFSGNISGAGTVVQKGTGATTLTGANSYGGGTLVSAGTLVGSASSFGTGVIVDNAALVIDQSTDAVFSNAIEGAGSLTKAGAGKLDFSSTSTLSGPTTVAAGILAVNGSLAGSRVDVLEAATLAGGGVVGGAVIRSGGIVAPGHSIGTLSIAGNFTQSAGSTYQVQVDPGSTASDLIKVSGAATLDNGAELNVLKVSPGEYSINSRYTVLTATNGVTGTYTLSGDITGAFFRLEDTYDAGNVYLTPVQVRSFLDAGLTPNEIATAGGLQTLRDGHPLKDAVGLLATDLEARNAFNQLSGEIHASARTQLIQDSRFAREAAIDRLQSDFCVVGGAGQAEARQSTDRRLRGTSCDPDHAMGWTRVFGSWGRTDSDGNAAQLERSIGGLFVGTDIATSDTWRAGALLGYSRASLDVDDRNSSADSRNYHLGIYAGSQGENLGLRLGAVHSLHKLDTRRDVAFSNIAEHLEAGYSGATTQVFGELGYRFVTPTLQLEPFAALAHVRQSTDSFQERGGVGALSGSSESNAVTFSTLGMRASTQFKVGDAQWRARGTVGWRHSFNDEVPSTVMSFSDSGPFLIHGVPIANDVAIVEVGLEAEFARNAVFSASYTGQFGDGLRDNGVEVRVNWSF